MPTRKKSKAHRGPPAVKYDVKVIENMASFGCTLKEIATVCGFGESRFRALRQDHPEIQEAIDLGRANLCQKLRKKQIELAMDGNPQMLIFLGKALLEQSDKVEINHNVKAEVEYEVIFGDPTHQSEATEASSEATDSGE
jgi:hypothetical protein